MVDTFHGNNANLVAAITSLLERDDASPASDLGGYARKLLESAADRLAAAPTPSDAVCTCPSGDGSLRWPCPAHPPQADPAPSVAVDWMAIGRSGEGHNADWCAGWNAHLVASTPHDHARIVAEQDERLAGASTLVESMHTALTAAEARAEALESALQAFLDNRGGSDHVARAIALLKPPGDKQ